MVRVLVVGALVLTFVFGAQLALQGSDFALPDFRAATTVQKRSLGEGGSIRSNQQQQEELDDDEQSNTSINTNTCLSLQAGYHPDPLSPIDPDNRYTPNPFMEKRKCLLYTQPSPYIDLLIKALVGFPNQGTCIPTEWTNCIQSPGGTQANAAPYDAKLRKYGADWPPFGYTMVGTTRLENFRAAVEEVNRNQIPGAIMELGVWRGGAMILAAAVQKEYNNDSKRQKKEGPMTMDRDLFVLDAFEDIPPLTYGDSSHYLFNTQQDVIDNFKFFNVYDPNKVHFVKGLFKDTVPQVAANHMVDRIAVLRVDGNFYDSYQDALYYLYGRVPVGGIVIFDDVMSHAAVMQCWLDFKQDHGLTEDLNRIDEHSAWLRKEREVLVDISKMRPPRDINLPN